MQSTFRGSESQAARSGVRRGYKFQRLRERLRAAIASGELSGKLPGERELARTYRVNAKTLSKALLDLAAEGLLERRVGRGTFARDSRAVSELRAERWLILCNQEQVDCCLVNSLLQANPAAKTVTDPAELRPSLLNQTRAVIDISSQTPDALLRDLVVRNLTVVLVGRQPQMYSVHAVLVDRALGATCLGRDLMMRGHRRLLAVEPRGQSVVAEALRRTAERFAPDATVDPVNPLDVPAAIEGGGTAVVCGCRKLALEVRELLAGRGIDVPQRVSLGAIGSGAGNYPCSGYFVHAQQKAEMVVHLIRDPGIRRPAIVWLCGNYEELGTIDKPHSLIVPAGFESIRPPSALFGSLSRDIAG